MRTRTVFALALACSAGASTAGCDIVLGLHRAQLEQVDGGSTSSSSNSSATSTTTSSTGGAGTGGSGGVTTGTGGAPLCKDGVACWSAVWGDSTLQEALDVATDAAGADSFVVGRYQGIMQFDATNELVADTGSQNGFLVGLGPDGAVFMSRNFGASGGQIKTVSSVAVDLQGNVIVGGYTDHVMTLQGGGNVLILPGLFLAKLTHAGIPIWGHSFGGSDGSVVYSVTADKSGNIAACGAYLGSIDVGSGSVMTSGGTDAWLMQVSGVDGSMPHGATWGDAQNQSCRAVRVDNLGNLVVAGSFQGQIKITTGAAANSAGMNDVFIARLNTDLSVDWQKSFGDASEQTCQGLAMDSSGGVALTGQISGTIDFDGKKFNVGSSMSLFAVTYSKDGTFGWGNAFGESGEVHPAFDAAGELTLAGGFYGQINLGAMPVSNTGGIKHAIFVAKLDSNGGQRWLKSFGDGTAEDAVRAVAMTPAGEPIAVGTVDGTINFGDGQRLGQGTGDAFVVKLGK